MFSLFDNGWYFQDEESYWHGPFEDRDKAQVGYTKYLEKNYAKPCEGDLVEVEQQ